jgi:hypothetical protein
MPDNFNEDLEATDLALEQHEALFWRGIEEARRQQAQSVVVVEKAA